MPDIAINWNRAANRGDWVIENGDLKTDSALRSAVLLCLFTDKRCPADMTPPDDPNEPRGHWTDTLTGNRIGSWLWLYRRAKKAANTNLPLQFQNAAADALGWLIEDKVAATVDITAGWVNGTTLSLQITVTEPNGTVTPFNFEWAWKGI